MTRTRLLLALALALVAGACGGTSTPPPQTTPDSPGPVLVVERFLQAANTNDLETMMQLFGTSEATIDQLDGRSQAERRLYVLASLLRHDDYRIVSQEGVPGRWQTATRIQVELARGDRQTVVPWVLVQRNRGGWIIEQIDVQQLTRQG